MATYDIKEQVWDIDCTTGTDITEYLLTQFTYTSNPELVTKLSFDGNPTLEKIPQGAFKTLTGLEELSIADCSITDVHKDSFTNLFSLRTLSLANNPIQALDEDTFRRNCTNLHELDLSQNNLITVPQNLFENLAELTALHMHHTLLGGNLPVNLFSSMPKLEQLELQHGHLGSIKVGTFDGLTELTALEIDHNWLSSIDDYVFKDCQKIENLYLHNNNLTTLTDKTLYGLPKVEFLALRHNLLNSDHVSARAFGGMESVKVLLLDHNSLVKVHPYLFEDQVALKSLDISYNAITGISRHAFHGGMAATVTRISIRNNHIDILPQDTFHDLGILNVLEMQFNNLMSLPPKIFLTIRTLKALFVDNVPGLSSRHYCNLAGDVKVYVDGVEQDQTDRACMCGEYENHACPSR
jgi:Leucine-rich repeat (LRR) protein